MERSNSWGEKLTHTLEPPPGGLVSYLAFFAGGPGVSGPRERPGLPVTDAPVMMNFLQK